MTRDFYNEQLEFHEKEVFESPTDALFDAAYLLGMLSMEKLEDKYPIHRKLMSLIAEYSWKIKNDIREGKIAQIRLKNLEEQEED